MESFWSKFKKPIIALAPMEGITDSPFRRIVKRFGADIVYTEFVSSDAIARQAPTALSKLRFHEDERPIVCQIFGRDVTAFAAAAREVASRGFDGIDINFGCPARKVVGSGSGVALMRDPQYARRLVESVAASVRIPISIKVRASIRRERKEVEPGCADRYTALDLVEALRGLPVAALMIHGRSFEHSFSGAIDRDMIRDVTQGFDGVVLANGGLYARQDVDQMINFTGAGGVGIARGALGKPWFLAQLMNPTDSIFGQSVIRETIIRHAQLVQEHFGLRGIIDFRKHLGWYCKGFSGAAQLRKQLASIHTLTDIEQMLAAVTWGN